MIDDERNHSAGRWSLAACVFRMAAPDQLPSHEDTFISPTLPALNNFRPIIANKNEDS